MEERALAAIEARLQRLAGEFDSRRQGHSAKKASRGGGSGGSGGGGGGGRSSGGGSSSPDRYTGRPVPPPQLAPAKPALEPEPEPEPELDIDIDAYSDVPSTPPTDEEEEEAMMIDDLSSMSDAAAASMALNTIQQSLAAAAAASAAAAAAADAADAEDGEEEEEEEVSMAVPDSPPPPMLIPQPASSTSMRDLRMSELLERMHCAGIAQPEIDRCLDTASPKGTAILLLEARREAQAADPAKELHQLALEAEILLGPAGHLSLSRPFIPQPAAGHLSLADTDTSSAAAAASSSSSGRDGNWLSRLGLASIAAQLEELGVEEESDLKFLEESEIASLNLKPVTARKLRRAREASA